jgi:hypothetical protein
MGAVSVYVCREINVCSLEVMFLRYVFMCIKLPEAKWTLT